MPGLRKATVSKTKGCLRYKGVGRQRFCAMTSPSIDSLADVVKRLMAKDWGLPLNDGSLNDGSLSQSMVKAPRTSELDDVVMVIYLAVDRGMNPAVWLEPEEDEEQGPRRDGEDDLLLTTEFFDRIQSLKLVFSYGRAANVHENVFSERFSKHDHV